MNEGCYIIEANSWFDGDQLHNDAVRIVVENGLIQKLIKPEEFNSMAETNLPIIKNNFVMPGLVEAHCHLFLNGDELKVEARSEYLNRANLAEMLVVAKNNVERYRDFGVTLIRDAGDIHGVNIGIQKHILTEVGYWPKIRVAGKAIRKAKNYGSFMALEVDADHTIEQIVDQIAVHANDLKIILTGIIDFEKGQVRGVPQFDLSQAKIICECSKKYKLLTFAHCSGKTGIEIAIDACINSIEHGFFMFEEALIKMAQNRIAWVPTFSPVYFQWSEPQQDGWSASALEGLKSILVNHFENLKKAFELGVPVVAGSDAGSYGVRHGYGLIDELKHFLSTGVSLDKVLSSATTTPRRLWGEEEVSFKVGNTINAIVLENSPMENIKNIASVIEIFVGKKSYKTNFNLKKGEVLWN